ncbi:putative Phox-associated domain-containing protein [Septoria linicola]|nr:putative Phox-associated domain-containing protein [Septoria linicola]
MAQGSPRPAKQLQHRKGPSYSQRQDRYDRLRIDDEATKSYIKRILCAPKADPASTTETADSDGRSPESLEQLLPPLSSSNEVDVQLYALIAVVLDLFVQAWYNRITPDHDFVASIVQIIAHCTRALEQRLRYVDLESLVLDELPELLSDHVNAVRIAQDSQSIDPTISEVRLKYHALRPHAAVTPCPVNPEAISAQQESEVAWCLLLVNRVLSLLLPPEDLQNPCLEVLVSEVLAELIFHNGILGKACEPWLLWDSIAKLLRAQRPVAVAVTQISTSSYDAAHKRGMLDVKAAANTGHDLSFSQWRPMAVTHAFWTIVQAIVTVSLLLRSFAIALMHAAKIPQRPQRTTHISGRFAAAKRYAGQEPSKAPVLDYSDTARPLRMPWLSGMFSLLLWMVLHGPGQVCRANSRLDRLLSSNVRTRLLSANWIPSALQAARSALFPENVLAPARVPPKDHEVLVIKRECAMAIIDAVPGIVRDRFFATNDVDLMIEDVECELDLLGDSYLNKHLIVRVVELIVARLFPELADHSGEAIMEVVAQ